MEQSALIPGQPTLFPIDPRSEYSEKVCAYIDKFWTEIKSSGKIDAGIATEQNLILLKERGYNYLCVSRTKSKDCTLKADGRTVMVMDSRNRPITIAEVDHEDGGDYFLRIKSPSKAMTEQSMNRQWRERFEAELTKARNALTKKGVTKTYDRVVERVGRAQGRYPSITKYYQIDYLRSEENPAHMADIRWSVKISEEEAEQRFGTYFLRTKVSTLDGRSAWDYYNLIRSNRRQAESHQVYLNGRGAKEEGEANSSARRIFSLSLFCILSMK